MRIKSGNTSIQFVAYGGDPSAKEQRRAHSHAARVAHARARRLRTIEYQASKAAQQPQNSQAHEEHEIGSKGCDILSLSPDEIDQPILSLLGLLASDRRDPFSCFARKFEPIEHFLLDHYVRAVVPYMNVSCNKLKDPARFVDLMNREWVRLTLTNTGSLNAVFLAACRHLLIHQQQKSFMELAIQFKLSCIQALRKTINVATPSIITDSTIAIGVLLAYDEIQLGDTTTLDCHLKGLIRMVEHNGGPGSMGASGFLERLVSKFTTLTDLTCKYEMQPW